MAFKNFFKFRNRLFLKNTIIRLSLYLSIFFNYLTWVVLLSRIIPQENNIPLHSNYYFGIDLVGGWYLVFTVPLAGLLFILINFFLSYFFFSKQKQLTYLLVVATIIIQFVHLLGALNIVLINQL